MRQEYTIVETTSLPPHILTSGRRELNDLRHGPSSVFIIPKGDGLLGAVRVATREDEPRYGLITDLTVADGAPNRKAMLGALVECAENALRARGVSKVDALIPDGKGMSDVFTAKGYWASRKTVAIRFTADQPLKTPSVGSVTYRMTDRPDPERVADFILSSYQPYWRWWKDDLSDKLWDRVDFPDAKNSPSKVFEKHRPRIVESLRSFSHGTPATMMLAERNGSIIGLCDAVASPEEQFSFGVLMTRDHPGRGFGASLLLPMLRWLKERGYPEPLLVTTSGLDDYDPTVYLATQSCGGSIVGEFIDLVKRLP